MEMNIEPHIGWEIVRFDRWPRWATVYFTHENESWKSRHTLFYLRDTFFNESYYRMYFRHELHARAYSYVNFTKEGYRFGKRVKIPPVVLKEGEIDISDLFEDDSDWPPYGLEF